MNQTEIYETVIYIIESTCNGQELSPRHLKLTESLVNGFITNEGIEELKRVQKMIANRNYVDWFHGIEHLTLSHDGDIKWKGVTVDCYGSTYETDTRFRELHSRCLHIESIGLNPNARNCAYYWDEYKELQANTIGSAYPWVIEYYYDGEGKWRQIDEYHYDWFLGCVPPVMMTSNGFLCSEPYTHQDDGQAVYLGCRCHDGKFYAKLMTTREYHVKMRETIEK